MEAHDSAAIPIHITSGAGWVPLHLKEVWEARELLVFLAWRDLRVRYKQTLLGVSWAVVKPVCLMLVFSIFLGWLARVPSDGVPYPVFTYCALLPWMLFAQTLAGVSHSVVANQNLITKVYFPRLVIPLSSLAVGLVDFVIAAVVLFVMMTYYNMMLIGLVWVLPLFLLLALATALGIGLWCSALEVRYRDVGHALPFLTQLWLFATPIAYPLSLIPESWRVWYGLNPMVSVVEGFRWSLLGAGSRPGAMCLVSVLTSLIVLVSGLYYFRRTEETFADLV
jgi:lipopolysaccharide transport system permease protein